jgi:hypothetical protein
MSDEIEQEQGVQTKKNKKCFQSQVILQAKILSQSFEGTDSKQVI